MGNRHSGKLIFKRKKHSNTTIHHTIEYLKQKSKPIKEERSLCQTKQLIICGLIRQYLHLVINPEDISQDIIDVCSLFYSPGDRWDLYCCDSRLSVDNEHLTIAKPPSSGHDDISRYYAFGSDQIQKFQKRVWKMKITESEYDTPSMSIGIIDATKIQRNVLNGFVPNGLDHLYEKRYKLLTKSGVVCDGEHSNNYCESLKEGDVIEMTLDLTDRTENKGKLSFCINGKKCGIAWNNIDIRKVYSLCVAINRKGTLQVLQ